MQNTVIDGWLQVCSKNSEACASRLYLHIPSSLPYIVPPALCVRSLGSPVSSSEWGEIGEIARSVLVCWKDWQRQGGAIPANLRGFARNCLFVTPQGHCRVLIDKIFVFGFCYCCWRCAIIQEFFCLCVIFARQTVLKLVQARIYRMSKCFSFLSFSVQLVVRSFPGAYVERFLDFLAAKLDSSAHLQFYVQWCSQLLVQHGPLLKKRSMSVMAAIKNLQKSISQRQGDLGQMYVHIAYCCRVCFYFCLLLLFFFAVLITIRTCSDTLSAKLSYPQR